MAALPGWSGRYRTSIWRFRTRLISPVREERKNPISLALIRLSKHSNLENRTESAESKGPERNGPFGEE